MVPVVLGQGSFMQFSVDASARCQVCKVSALPLPLTLWFCDSQGCGNWAHKLSALLHMIRAEAGDGQDESAVDHYCHSIIAFITDQGDSLYCQALHWKMICFCAFVLFQFVMCFFGFLLKHRNRTPSGWFPQNRHPQSTSRRSIGGGGISITARWSKRSVGTWRGDHILRKSQLFGCSMLNPSRTALRHWGLEQLLRCALTLMCLVWQSEKCMSQNVLFSFTLCLV